MKTGNRVKRVKEKKQKITLSLIWKDLKRYKWLYLCFALPVVLWYAIFHYIPLYGIQIAFRDYKLTKGIWGSPFVGFENFLKFFQSIYF